MGPDAEARPANAFQPSADLRLEDDRHSDDQTDHRVSDDEVEHLEVQRLSQDDHYDEDDGGASQQGDCHRPAQEHERAEDDGRDEQDV